MTILYTSELRDNSSAIAKNFMYIFNYKFVLWSSAKITSTSKQNQEENNKIAITNTRTKPGFSKNSFCAIAHYREKKNVAAIKTKSNKEKKGRMQTNLLSFSFRVVECNDQLKNASSKSTFL